MREKIKTLLQAENPLISENNLGRLMEDSLLDSFNIIHLVKALESEFALELTDDDLVEENFASLEAIATMIEARREAESA